MQFINSLLFYFIVLETLFRSQSYFITQLGEPQVRIILPKQNTMLGAGGKHAVGFFGTFGNKVINKYADITFRAFDNKFIISLNFSCRIDSCHKALASRLFVTGCTVNLAGEE